MKLLSRKEIKNKQSDELIQAQKITKFVSDESKKLNDFKRETENKKRAILEDFVSFANKMAGEKAELEIGLQGTEAKKTQAFNSLARLSVDAEKKYQLAQDIEAKTTEREALIKVREEKIDKRTADVDAREVIINGRADEVYKRAEAVVLGEEKLEALKQKTLADLAEREKKTKKGEQSIDTRLGELVLAADALKKNTELLDSREKQIIADNEKEKILIADSRATLQRAWDEFNKKQQ